MKRAMFCRRRKHWNRRYLALGSLAFDRRWDKQARANRNARRLRRGTR